jgi:FemAB-related protein (PEP-CTERM system-associated)
MRSTTLPTTAASPPRASAADSVSPLAIRPITCAAGVAAWGAYAEQHPAATLFHHPDWCAAVETAFGHRPVHLGATRGTRVVGVLPLMDVRSLLGGRLLVSVPYGTYGGILADDAATCGALAEAAARLARRCGARVLELRSATADVTGYEPIAGYVGFARALPDSVEDVPAFLPKRARAAARHARDREGVVIRHDAALLDVVWELYCRSMRRIGSVNYPRGFFTALFDRLGTRAWASVAFLGERPVAGTVSLVFGRTLMPYILGADERVRCEGAANLLYGSVMERAVAAGLRRFDYGRSRADNVGAVGFKKNQGFEPTPLGYQRYVPPGRTAPDLRPTNPRFALARRAWRHLPLPVTRAAGTWLARSLPG